MIKETVCAKETFELGKQLGETAQPGQVFCLTGDLGAGKTVFTQGFAKGLGIEAPVSSPTFTIIKEYQEGRLTLYHFDVYRIGDLSEMDEIGYEEYFYSEGVCLVEWGDMIKELLPPHTVYITIQKSPGQGFDYRKITIGALQK